MIKQVSIVNFQSHRSTTIDFCSGINAIIGPTHNGKSTIVRALYWLAENRPVGESFRTHGEESVGVEVEFSDGTVVKRVKGSENLYCLNSRQFKAFRQEVPADIREAVNMTEINWQTQFSPPFLVNDGASAVAKALNAIANLEIIQQSLTKLSSHKRGTNAKINALEYEVEDNSNAIKKYDSLPEDMERYDQLVVLEKEIAVLQEFLQVVDSLVSVEAAIAAKQEIADLSEQVAAIDALWPQIEIKLHTRQVVAGLIQLAQGTDKAIGAIAIFANQKDRVESIDYLYSEIAELTTKKQQLDATIRDCEKYQVAIDSLSVYSSQEATVRDMSDSLQAIQEKMYRLADVTRSVNDLSELDSKIEQAHKCLHEGEANLVGKVCPTCGREVK